MKSLRRASAQIKRLISNPAMRQRILAPVSFDAAILGLNMVTGIMVARSLGPSGRGEIAAILILMQTVAWLASIGGRAAISFHQSRHPEHGAALIGSWLIVTLPLGLLAIGAAEFLLPTLFNAQTAETINLARDYLFVSLITIVTIVFNGILLGDQRFFVYNVTRLLVPVVTAIGYLALLLTNGMSVESALVATAVAALVSMIAAAISCLARHGIAAPSSSLMLKTVWYGIRAHGGDVAGFVSARLDLLIIPAFLSAASVGLYSVATNVSSIIATLTGTIAIFVLPVAARDAKGSARTVVRAFHATLLIGGLLGLFLVVVAEVAIKAVYGSDFGGAATALRILIPGEVLEAASTVLWAGMLAANRPLLSSAAYLPTAALTIAGLIVFLPSGGIDAAAIITTCAYTLAFAISVVLFRQMTGLRWRQLIRAPAAEASS